MNRRDFLRALGIGTAALAIEPVRKMWFVPSNYAVAGSRVELYGANPPVALADGRWVFASELTSDMVPLIREPLTWAVFGDTRHAISHSGQPLWERLGADGRWHPASEPPAAWTVEQAWLKVDRITDDMARQLQTFGHQAIVVPEGPEIEVVQPSVGPKLIMQRETRSRTELAEVYGGSSIPGKSWTFRNGTKIRFT